MNGVVLAPVSASAQHVLRSDALLLAERMPGFQVATHLDRERPDVVIRWGAERAPAADSALGLRAAALNGRLELNPAPSLRNVVNPERRQQILELNRLPLADDDALAGTCYEIHLVDLAPVHIAVRHGRRSKPRPIDVRHFHDDEVGLALSTAIRCLHAFRLHFGRVDVIGRGRRRPLVASVDPAPKLSPELAEVYARALQRALEASPQGSRVALGADPEFALWDKARSRMVLASQFFARLGSVGCDRHLWQRRNGQHPVAELRPEPSPEPRELVERLRNLLAEAKERIGRPGVAFVAGSRAHHGLCLGGHIHLSGRPISSAVVRALDNYLAIPLLLIERPRSASYRRTRYGFLGDVRLKAHGGFEYRTPGSWIVSPRIALATLTLAQAVVMHASQLLQDPLSSPAFQEAFYAADNEPFFARFDELWADITALPDHATRAEELSLLERMIRGRYQWREAVDIRRTWKLI